MENTSTEEDIFVPTGKGTTCLGKGELCLAPVPRGWKDARAMSHTSTSHTKQAHPAR